MIIVVNWNELLAFGVDVAWLCMKYAVAAAVVVLHLDTASHFFIILEYLVVALW